MQFYLNKCGFQYSLLKQSNVIPIEIINFYFIEEAYSINNKPVHLDKAIKKLGEFILYIIPEVSTIN